MSEGGSERERSRGKGKRENEKIKGESTDNPPYSVN